MLYIKFGTIIEILERLLTVQYAHIVGPTKIDVTYEGLQIPKSPFNVKVTPGCDPTRVRAYGPGKKNLCVFHEEQKTITKTQRCFLLKAHYEMRYNW